MCQDIFDENNVELVEDIQETVEETKFGVVESDKLIVRDYPDIKADIVSIIDKNSEVMIYDLESTEEFYAICTASGIEGFCMKQFIAVQ